MRCCSKYSPADAGTILKEGCFLYRVPGQVMSTMPHEDVRDPRARSQLFQKLLHPYPTLHPHHIPKLCCEKRNNLGNKISIGINKCKLLHPLELKTSMEGKKTTVQEHKDMCAWNYSQNLSSVLHRHRGLTCSSGWSWGTYPQPPSEIEFQGPWNAWSHVPSWKV